jgi:putative ABC transport system permease protein
LFDKPSQLWRRLLFYLQRERFDRDLEEEMRFHLEMKAEENIAAGISPEEARYAAQRQFGNQTFLREMSHDMWSFRSLETLAQDLRYGLRMMLKNPGFTVTIILTLALSIGANTAIFSIVNALLLKDLPYAQPERIGTIYARTTGSEPSDQRRTIDGEQWELLRDNAPFLISAVSGLRTSSANLRAGSHVQYLRAGRVSAHYFDVLALHPIIGRNFSEEEDRPHGPKSAILSYALWRSAFYGNPNVLGQAVLLKGEPYTIIGVLPENATTPLNADIYTALQPSREGEGQATNFAAIIRLRDGATWRQADVELNRALTRSLRAQRFARSNSGGPGGQIAYYSMPLQKAETNSLRPQALALMLAAGFILFIACANLAGLTMVRVLRRRGEIVTRLALGASQWRIQRQLWIENLLLALVGGGAGIGVGFIALRGLLLLLPEHFLPVATVPLDARVLGFTLSLSLLTCVLFGMLPALAARKVDLRSYIPNRGIIGAGSVRLRQWLIAGEIALTVVLLASAGLLIRTLIHLETLPPGFNPTGVITAKVSLDDVRYHDPAAFRRLLNESLVAMREIPGVQNAAVGLTLPYERALLNGVTISDGKEAGQSMTTNAVYVTPGYFDALQIPVIAGRAFADADSPDAQQVMIVNRTFARKFFHGADPVGRYLNKNMLIVGVVGDTVLSSAAKLNAGSAPLTSEETIYLPAAQIGDAKFLSLVHGFFQPSWVVRAAGPVEGLTVRMQRALASADPDLPFSGFSRMNDLMAATLATQRIQVALLTAMSLLALLLSAVGIFGLVANLVTQRTREIGVRIALGATTRMAMINIGRSGVGASALGLILGLIICAGALRALRSVLYGVGVYDAPTILVVALTVSVVTLLATIAPILRIARIDPANVLREE